MSDKLTPGQLRDLADIIAKKPLFEPLGTTLRRIADEREAEAPPIPPARLPEIAAWVRQVRAEALPPHMVKLPGGAVVEVLSNGDPERRWLAVPNNQPCVRIHEHYAPSASSLERDEMFVSDRPAWITDEMLADVQRWLDERGIKLEGGR